MTQVRMKWIQFVLITIGMCVSSMVFAGDVEFEVPETQSATVDHVKFSVTSQNYKIIFGPGDYSWGTRAFAKYETENVDQLEDYAVVQFTRGCQFKSAMTNGKIIYNDNTLRYLFNKLVLYKFSDWVIDSGDDYPMFANTPEDFDYEGHKPTRHGLYTWNRHDNFDQDGEVLFYKEKPQKPYLYTQTHPGTAFLQGLWAKNISQEYRTCLYKTKDIPMKGTPQDLNFAKPLKCFNWSTSFIYNFSSKEFSRPTELDPHCTVIGPTKVGSNWSN